MSVYVDHLMTCVWSRHWPWTQSCHLVADTLGELHAFAQRLGLRRGWFQDSGSIPHYDLTKGKREAAVRCGATEISRSEFVSLMRTWRTARAMELKTGSLFEGGAA